MRMYEPGHEGGLGWDWGTPHCGVSAMLGKGERPIPVRPRSSGKQEAIFPLSQRKHNL